MTIERIIPRDEILKMFLDINKKLPLERVRRFIQLFRLTDNEIEMFKLRYLYDDLTLKYIAYYQENDYNAFFVNSKLQTFKKTRFAGKTPNTIKSNNNE